MIERCRSCYSKNLIEVGGLGDQHLSDFINPGDPQPEKYRLDVIFCRDCTLLQLADSVPPRKMYNDHYGYRSGISNTMRQELDEIVAKAKRIYSENSKRTAIQVLDIGCNDGTLLDFYGSRVKRVGVEPVTKFAREAGKRHEVINDFFSKEAVGGRKFDIITAISMFYDLEDPNDFVEDVKDCLSDDGIFVIQQNYLADMIRINAVDNICHEHLEYYSLTSLEHLLHRHGLEIFKVERTPINGGSFRTYARKVSVHDELLLLERQMRLEDPATYLEFGQRARASLRKLNDFIEAEVDAGKTVYIYGASTRGNSLVQAANLDHRLIKAAVERNPEKFGKIYAGTEIPIISEERARAEKPDYFLVLPFFFRDEIVEREKEFIRSGGKLIFPLPEFEVVG